MIHYYYLQSTTYLLVASEDCFCARTRSLGILGTRIEIPISRHRTPLVPLVPTVRPNPLSLIFSELVSNETTGTRYDYSTSSLVLYLRRTKISLISKGNLSFSQTYDPYLLYYLFYHLAIQPMSIPYHGSATALLIYIPPPLTLTKKKKKNIH